MDKISIIKGNPRSDIGSKLNCMALDYMAYPLAGSKNFILIQQIFNRLWKINLNRFSYEYAFEAQVNKKTVGMITCYPVSVMNKLAWPTVQKLIKIRKLPLIGHSALHFREAWSMASLKEGRHDEYHISTIATLPESRGYGVGSKLIKFAEGQARLNHYNKCSLTVKKENKQALKLYERLGYQITDSIEKAPYSLYRMVKNLPLHVLV